MKAKKSQFLSFFFYNMISMYPHSTENVKPRNKQINKQTNKNTTQRTKIIFLFFYIFLLELQGWALRLIVDRQRESFTSYTFADHTCLQHSFYFDDQIIIPVRLMQLRCTWGLLWWRPAGVANTMRKTNCYKCVCLNIFIYLYLSSQFQVKQELDQLCHALCGYCRLQRQR